MERERGICVIDLGGWTPLIIVTKPPKMVSRVRNDGDFIGQEAQLTQRDRASILSVEIV